MNKKLLLVGTILIAGLGLIFKDSLKGESEVEKLRKQHAEFLKNHPLQSIAELPKKERKAQGLPPNAYFEQKYLSEINPYTGKTHKENIFKLQEELNIKREGLKVPGEVDNAWIERGPDNVGGRTRALIFDPNDTTNETVFAGGVSGGLWKNTNISNPDSKWVKVGVSENLAVSSIAVDPNNSQVFYLGTGESYTNGDANGNGVWKSIDGGNTWSRILGGVTGNSFLDTNAKLTITSPSSLTGEYVAVLTTSFGGDIPTPINNELVLVDDGNAPSEDGCEVITNTSELNGKIAVIRRGSCNFSQKAKNAQDAGAIAVIITNNQQTNPFNMAAGDGADQVTIPSIMISKEIGDAIINELSSGPITGVIEKVNESAINSTLSPGIQYVNDLVVRNNGGVSEVFVAVGEAGYIGGVSVGGDTFGVYKSVDGENFTKLNIPKTSSGNEYEPNNIEISSDNSIYISTTSSFTYGDGGGTIFKSTNGTDFSLVHSIVNGLRTEIATASSTPGLIYVLAQMDDDSNPVKIFKTVDDFVNVTEQPLPNDADNGIPANDFTRGQAFYDLLIKVDPNHDNVVYVGGIDLFKSTDATDSWNQISKWSNNNNLASLDVPLVHADQHGLAFASSDKMIFGNDGGVYFSDSGALNIDARNNNYNTLQFYTVGVGPLVAFDNKEYFLAGAQDNGTQLISEALEGINSSERVQGGDGAASFFDVDGTDKYFISNYVFNGSINLYNFETLSWVTINSENAQNGDFINQEELDSHLNILYSNYSSGQSFIIRRYASLLQTPIIKTNLTNDLMNSEPSAFKVSPYTTLSTKLFVGLKNGKLLKVDNANEGQGTWSEITGENFVGSISDIEIGESEEDIFVTMHNYGVVNVWYTNDGGITWSNKEGNLPDLPVKSILQNPLSRNEVIIGTDLGVWKTSNFNENNPNWEQSYNGMSYVPVLDLDLREDNTVFAATYGRGIFSGKFTMDPNGDADGDGVLNGADNCPNTSNADQADTDGNGIGDVCQDTDGDGVMDDVDNCVNTSNPDQGDFNNDGIGDVCQDSDNDGVMDNVDNCPEVANADQADFNNDGIGDACQDSDGDGVMDDVDNCPEVANADQADSDGNGIGDVCQDSDGDGIMDVDDNCVNTSNPNQADFNNDGIGDACQDSDNDGIMDDTDNCIDTPNPDQADVNNNGIGDVCDTSYENQGNIKIEFVSETCQGEEDGKITITIVESFVDYSVTLNGGSAKTITGSSTSTTYENLSPGSYEVCVSVTGRDYTQCFEINIDSAETISLRVGKKEASNTYEVKVNSGTAPYDVYLNGGLIGTYNTSSFEVQTEEKGVLEVKTSKACEGSFKTVIDGVFLKTNPIVRNIELLVPNNLNTSEVKATVYDLSGKVILNNSFTVNGNNLTIPFESYSSGIYIVKLGIENSEPIKILK